MLDYFNAAAVRAALVPREERTTGGERVVIERRLSPDGRHVFKEMHLLDDGRSFVERVRLFSPDDLAALLGAAGLRVCDRFGDYSGAPISPEAPRAILVGARP